MRVRRVITPGTTHDSTFFVWASHPEQEPAGRLSLPPFAFQFVAVQATVGLVDGRVDVATGPQNRDPHRLLYAAAIRVEGAAVTQQRQRIHVHHAAQPVSRTPEIPIDLAQSLDR